MSVLISSHPHQDLLYVYYYYYYYHPNGYEVVPYCSFVVFLKMYFSESSCCIHCMNN